MNAATVVDRQLFTLEEAGRVLGCSHWLLRKHIERGTVRPTRLGRLVKLSSAEIERIQEQGLPPLRQ